MIKWSIQQKDLIIIYVPNITGPKYTKEIFTDIEIDSNIIIVGEFSIPLSMMDRTSRQEIKKQWTWWTL